MCQSSSYTIFTGLSEAELLILLNKEKIVTKGDIDQHSEAVARVNVKKNGDVLTGNQDDYLPLRSTKESRTEADCEPRKIGIWACGISLIHEKYINK